MVHTAPLMSTGPAAGLQHHVLSPCPSDQPIDSSDQPIDHPLTAGGLVRRQPLVLACSALKPPYRRTLTAGLAAQSIAFVGAPGVGLCAQHACLQGLCGRNAHPLRLECAAPAITGPASQALPLCQACRGWPARCCACQLTAGLLPPAQQRGPDTNTQTLFPPPGASRALPARAGATRGRASSGRPALHAAKPAAVPAGCPPVRGAGAGSTLPAAGQHRTDGAAPGDCRGHCAAGAVTCTVAAATDGTARACGRVTSRAAAHG